MTGAEALLFALATFLSSAIATRLSLAYAWRRGLIDVPGQRRSHRRATPRGGGLGIVLALLLAVTYLATRFSWPPAEVLPLTFAVLVVAAVGAWDDHRPQPVWLRLLAHMAAAAAVVGTLHVANPEFGTLGLALAAGAVVVSINFWNFMDGIDGLATSQASLVGLALVAAFAVAGAELWAALALAFCAATAGFLPFNLPRARIFLGDVGSGTLGLLVAILLLQAHAIRALDPSLALVLVSVFAVDAGATLALRILGGRRFTQAHRSHLYQWWVRRGLSHGRVTALYAAATLAALGWAAAWSGAAPEQQRIAALLWILVLIIAWSALRLRELRAVRRRV